MQAIQKGLTRYPPNVGIAELRKGMAQAMSRMSGGRPVDPDQLVVSSGSKQSIFNACFTLFGPKDRVLIPAPAWVSYPQIVHLCRAEPVLVPGDVEWGLKVSVKDLDRHYYDLDPRAHHLLALQSDRRGLHPGGAQGDRRVGQEARGVDHLGRDLPADQLRPGAGAVAPRPAGRAARADGDHLWREQGVRDDRLAHRRRAGAAAPDQGHGGAPVAHHHRGQPAGPVGRRRRRSPTNGSKPR
jgi:hypothetical protein